MTELDEANARRAFSEAVARFRRATATGAPFHVAWTAGMDAATACRTLIAYWQEQHADWVGYASLAVPDDAQDTGPQPEE